MSGFWRSLTPWKLQDCEFLFSECGYYDVVCRCLPHQQSWYCQPWKTWNHNLCPIGLHTLNGYRTGVTCHDHWVAPQGWDGISWGLQTFITINILIIIRMVGHEKFGEKCALKCVLQKSTRMFRCVFSFWAFAWRKWLLRVTTTPALRILKRKYYQIYCSPIETKPKYW